MGRQTLRRILLLLGVLWALALCAVACSSNGNDDDGGTATSDSASPLPSECKSGPEATSASCQAAGPGTTQEADRCPDSSPSALEGGVIEGTFGPWCENAIATAYDTVLIPPGAEVELTIRETAMDTAVELQVQGFDAGTDFSAVLHSAACGAEAADAGPEYVQENVSENVPSVLTVDFTTDADGSADASETVPWLVPDNGSGKSLVIHSAENQMAGCITIP